MSKRKSLIRFTKSVLIFWLAFFVLAGAAYSPLFEISNANAAVTSTGVLGFGETAADDNMQFLSYTSTGTYTDRGNSVDTSASTTDIVHVVMMAAPTRDEIMSAQLKTDGTMHVTKCVGGCDASGDWAEQTTLEIASVTATQTCDATAAACYRPLDIAYEALSGRAMVAYAKAANDGIIYYNIWDGTSWVGESSFTFDSSSIGDTRWVRLIADDSDVRKTNRILFVASESNGTSHEIYAAVWDGTSAFGNLATITGTSSAPNQQNFDGAWESSSGNALVVWAESTTASTTPFNHKKFTSPSTWDGSNQGAVETYAATGGGVWVELRSHPHSDRIAAALEHSGADGIAAVWKGDGSTAGWSTGGLEDASLETTLSKSVAVAWENYNSGTPFAIFTYADASTSDVSDYFTWTDNGTTNGTWGTSTDISGGAGDDVARIDLYNSPNDDEIMMIIVEYSDDLCFQRWSGSAWNANCTTTEYSTTLPPDTATAHNELNSYDFTYKLYSPWARNWRFTSDTSANPPGSWLANENTVPTGVADTTTLRLRYNFAELGNVAQSDGRKKLQFATADPDATTTTWTDVDAQGGGGVWRYANCTAGADDSAVTGGTSLTGSTVAGDYIENGTAAITITHAALAILENDYCMQANGVAASTTYYFRAYDNDQQAIVYREQDNDGSNDCATAVCTYPSLTTAAPVTTAGTTGSQTASMNVGATNQYVGGAFSFSNSIGSVNVTGITITESGTADGTNLDNIKLYYENDTSASYDCASESYAGGETQFGSTDADGFSTANGTAAFTGSVAITTTSTMCVYVVFDVTAGSGSETIEISIAATTDFTVSAGTKSGTPAISGTTTLAVANLTVAGNAYEDEATTALVVCDGSGAMIAVSVNGAAAVTGSCADANGSFSIDTGTSIPAAGTPIHIWVDGTTACNAVNTNSCGTTVIRYSGSGNITNAIVRRNRLVIRDDDGTAVSNANIGVRDHANDNDIVYDVDGSNNIIVEDNIKIIVPSTDSWTLGATVTTSPSADGTDSVVDGDITVEGTMTAAANAVSVGGDFAATGTFSYSGGQTTTFTATATGHTIDDGTNNFDTLIFNGSGGGWSLSNAVTLAASLTMTAGTLSGTSDLTVTTDVIGTAGVITLTSGTFEQRVGASEDFGPTTSNTDWTFNNLTFSRAAGTPTITKQSCSNCDVTVTGTLLVSKTSDGAATVLNPGDATWTLSNSNSAAPFDDDQAGGSLSASNSSTFVYSGDNDSGDVTIEDANFNNLTLGGAATENYAPAATLTISGNLAMNSNGTLNGSQSINVSGTVTGDGDINISGGTFMVDGTSFGGNTNWDFSTLNIGNGSGTTTTSATGSGSITVASALTIAANQTLDAKGKTWTLSGTSGTPLTITGALDDTANSSTFSFTGNAAGNTTVPASTAYHNITVNNGSETFVLAGTTTLSGTLTVTAGILDTTGSHHALSAAAVSVAGTLTANNSTITLTGGGSALAVSGTFNIGNSTVVYNSTSSTNIENTTYYHLSLTPSGGNPSYTTDTGSIRVDGNTTFGGGTTMTIRADSNSTSFDLRGSVTLANNTTYTKSSNTTVLKQGTTQTITDNNTTKQDLGPLQVSVNGGNTTLSLNSNIKVTTLTVDNSQNLTLGSNTLELTGTGTALSLGNGTFTVTGSTVQYTGTTATVAAATFNHLTLGGTGTYTMPASNMTLRGNLIITSSATVTKGAGTVIFAIGGGSSQTWTDNNGTPQDIGAVQISANTGNTTLNAGSNLKATSIAIDDSQSFVLAGGARTLTLTSNGTALTIGTGATFTDTDDTIAFVPGSAGTVTWPSRTYNILSFDGSGSTFRPGTGTLIINGTLTITNGTLDLNTNDPTTTVTGNLTNSGVLDAPSVNGLTFSGNFTNNGTFNANSGTVVATPSGSTTTINGSTATTNFSSFTMNQPTKALKFKAGNTYGFSGTLTLNGSQAQFMDLSSDTASSQWLINFTGTNVMTYLRIKDSGCAGGTQNLTVSESSVNNGNNASCWTLATKGGVVVDGDSGSGGGSGQSGGGSGGSGSGGGSSGGGGGTLPQTFTNSDGTALATHDSNWTILSGNFAINTNAVHSNSAAADTMAQWTGGSINSNQYAQITLSAVGAASSIGVAVRTQSGAFSGYGAYTDVTNVKIIEWNAGTPTTHYTGSAFSVNDVLRLEIEGSTLTLKKNGAVITTVSDSTHASGLAGLVGFGNLTLTLGDDWNVGSITGGGGGGGGGAP